MPAYCQRPRCLQHEEGEEHHARRVETVDDRHDARADAVEGHEEKGVRDGDGDDAAREEREIIGERRRVQQILPRRDDGDYERDARQADAEQIESEGRHLFAERFKNMTAVAHMTAVSSA